MKYLWILVIAIILVFATSALAGPFGLKMGMSKEQVGANLKHVESNLYETSTVPKAHSSFQDYLLVIDPQLGLAKILANTGEIKTSRYGTDLKSKFEEIEKQLISKYGSNNKFDYLMPDSIWDEPRDWMMSLIKEERSLSAFWGKETGANLSDDIHGIILRARASNQNMGYIFLIYEFSNFEQVADKKEKREADSL
jgi:hypothetical protein